MIKVIVICNVLNDKIEDFKKCANTLIKETLKEKGNISYELLQDKNNKTRFYFLEEWSSKEVLDKHSKSSHIKDFSSVLEDVLQSDLDISVVEKVLN